MRCESRLYGIAVDEVDSSPEEIFEEELEVHVRVKGAPPFLELDEDIDIALFTLFAPGKRPEDPDPPDAEAPDPFAVFRQRTEDAVSRKHTVSYSCYLPVRITLFPPGAVPAGVRHPGNDVSPGMLPSRLTVEPVTVHLRSGFIASGRPLHNHDLLLRGPGERIHDLADIPVCLLAGCLQLRPLFRRDIPDKRFVHRKEALDPGDDPVLGGGEVGGEEQAGGNECREMTGSCPAPMRSGEWREGTTATHNNHIIHIITL